MVNGPLKGVRVAVPDTDAASWHAARLLSWLGADVDSAAEYTGAERDWAESGVTALTGRRDGPPLLPPGQAASAVRGALRAIELLTGVSMPDARVLSERAAIAGLRRDAPWSAGGSLQVLRARDGWVGVNLARPSDIELVPAWLGESAAGMERVAVQGVPAAALGRAGGVLDADPWHVVERAVAGAAAGPLVERARLLGMPVSEWSIVDSGNPLALAGEPGRQRRLESAVVADLSSLWAGPLCGHLLTLMGARVIKVESEHRPDGARRGPREFYDLLHAGQESVALDFGTAEGRHALATLVDVADVVIEGSRPRALRQLGIEAEGVLARAGAKVWVSITAYGRTGPLSNAVGFGDDVAIAGGLLAFDPGTGTPAPCGDAIADSVTGVNAALVTVACLQAGGPWLADLAMRAQIAATLVAERGVGTTPSMSGVPISAAASTVPSARRPAGRASALGADTDRVLREVL